VLAVRSKAPAEAEREIAEILRDEFADIRATARDEIRPQDG
jgi:hypothetical protein